MLAVAATGLAADPADRFGERARDGSGGWRSSASPGSSGYDRLVLPLASLLPGGGRPGRVAAGHGAGQITADFGNAWPLVKLTYEYGLPTAVAWLGALRGRDLGPDERRVPDRGLRGRSSSPAGYLLSPIMVLFVGADLRDVRGVRRACGPSTGRARAGLPSPGRRDKARAGRGGRQAMRPVVLCILDGWGLSPTREGNAVALGRYAELRPHLDGPARTRRSPRTGRTSGCPRGRWAIPRSGT